MKAAYTVRQTSTPEDHNDTRVGRAVRFYEHDYAPIASGRNHERKRRPGWSDDQRKAAERQRRMWQEFFSASQQRVSEPAAG
jgi:hypothetical protein